ncbi:MAG: hypothetical protein GY856_10055 [bacterium]|nr:hypothetical protein [bacterium]
MRTLRLLLTALTALMPCLAAAPAGSQVVDEIPEICGSTPAHAAIGPLHERLERLDRDLQAHLVRVGRAAAAGRAPEARLPHDAEHFRRDLEALELAVHRRGPEVFERLRFKLHELGNLVANLERAATAGATPAVLPAYERRDRGRVRRIPAGPTAAPANDDCATVIGDGTWAGNTTEATNDGQASCGSSLFSPDVWFKYVAASGGYVSADTLGSAYDTVLSVHSACPGTPDNQLSCNDDAFGLQSAVSFYASTGEEYWIRVSGFDQATGPFQLTVGPNGGILGTVTASASGDPIDDGRVEAYNSGGYYERSGWTGATGEYTIPDLSSGTYHLATEYFDGYIDELYDDVPCPGGYHGCEHTDGTPVVVRTNTMTMGVDFALDEGGVLSGLVTQTATGDPIPDVRVEIFDSTGDRKGYDYTDAAGNYSVEGLLSGTYYAATDSSLVADELFDDLPCPGGAPYGCDPTTGTPIAVTVNATTAGIDFVLDRRGAVSGTVTEAATGDPIDGLRVEIHDANGYYVEDDYTDASGNYTVAGLAEGTYFAVAESYYFLDELYDDIPCPGGSGYGCDETTGTPIAVSINATTTGIDFALDRLGSISGTVTEAATGDPIYDIPVEVWDASGYYLRSDYTDSSGVYLVEPLPSGSHYVGTDIYYGEYVNELYEEIPCSSGCDPSTGTPVAVSTSVTTMGIDFTLDRLGAVSGTVTNSLTGDPLSSVRVRIWDGAGSYSIEDEYTDASGYYEVTGLEAGTYYATAAHSSYSDELYDDLPCPGGATSGCDPATGTAIAVSLNTTTTSVDFALDPGGSISGTLTEAATGEPLHYEDVEIWDATGSFVAYGEADYYGHYEVGGLAPGTYFVNTDTYQYDYYLDELYDDLPCPGGAPGGCDPTTGTPIAVTAGVTTSGVDFALGSKGTISGTVTDATSGDPISLWVNIWNAAGSWVDDDYTDSSGHYTVRGLAPGTYFATTDTYYSFMNELYDDLPCHFGCDPTTGSPIAVTLGADTSGIDFQLDRPGAISGAVTDAAGGEPLAGVRVRAWTANASEVGSDYTDAAGIFTIDELATGTYFLTTDNDDGFLDELYDDLPCLGGASYGGCTVTKGTPVAVTVNTTTRPVNFALQYFSSGIAGTVTDGSGIPLASVFVDAWDDDGDLVASTVSDAEGGYSLELGAGTYFVSTDNGLGLDDEVYDDLICPAGSCAAGLCDPTAGTPVVVTGLVGEMMTGIDFVLEPLWLFGDGFESGDLSAWSSAVGGP